MPDHDEHLNRTVRRALAAAVVLASIFSLLPLLWTTWALASADEDAYYFFSVARNLARGHGLTYSGEWTNGVQPLWVFLITPLFAAHASPLLPVRLAVSLSGLFAAASGIWVYRAGTALFGQRDTRPLIATFLWMSSPFVFARSAMGMETGLYLFCLAWLFDLYLRRVRLNPSPRTRDWMALGAVAGICFLARVDAALLLPPLWIAGAWRERASPRALSHALAGFAVFALVALPWVGYNVWLWGSPLPTSAMFTRVVFHVPMTLAERAPYALRAVLRVPIFYPFSFATFFYRDVVNVAAFILGAAFVGWSLARRPALRSGLRRLPFGEALASGALLLVGYVLTKTAFWFLPRYLLPLLLVSIFHCALFWHGVAGPGQAGPGPAGWMRRLPAAACAALVLLFAFAVPYAVLGRNMKDRQVYRVRTVDEIRRRIPAGTPLAAFQSGVYHYYLTEAGYPFYNLDGKVSIAAYRALRDHRMDEYLRERRVGYLIDWVRYLDPFIRQYGLREKTDYEFAGRIGQDVLVKLKPASPAEVKRP